MAHGHTILSWQENLAQDEVPPEWMWHLDEDLDRWFAEVTRARRERIGAPGDEEPEMMENELARRRARH